MPNKDKHQWSYRISADAEEPDSVQRVYWNLPLENLPFYPFCIEEMTQSKRTWYAEKFCQFMVIVIVTEGDIFYQVDNKDYLLVPGQVLIIPQGGSYFLQKGPSPHYKKIVAELKGNNLSSLAENLGLNRFLLIESSPIDRLQEIMKEIQHYLREDDPQVAPHLLGLAYELLATLALEIHSEQPPELFLQAQHLLENNLEQKISLTDIAQKLGTTVLSLNRLFQTRLQISPMRYRLDCRMAQAKYLLLQSNLSIKEISYRLGYCNPFYFSNEYRKFYGHSPRQTRQQKIL